MKPTYIVIGIIVLALIGGVVAGLVRQPSAETSPVQGATDFRLSKVGGGEGQLSEYYGQVVLINFWASWCGTCREEMPDIVETWREYRERGFTVVGVNYGEAEKEAVDFARTYGMEFPNFLDSGKQVAAKYSVISMPSSYLLDKTGKVKLFIPGKIDFSTLRPEIEKLLAEAK